MDASALNREYTLKLTLKDILRLIKSFTIEDKVIIEKQIEKETLKYRVKQLDKRIKPNNLTMEEIIGEVKEVRKSKKNG